MDTKSKRKTNKKPRWSDKEREILETLFNEDTIERVTMRYNKWASTVGFPLRSQSSIEKQYFQQNLSKKPIFNGWSCHALSKLLGIPRYRLYYWIKKGYIGRKRRKKGHYRILKTELLELIRIKPTVIEGASEDFIKWLLEDEEDDLKIVTTKPLIQSNNAVYKNIKEAAAGEHYSLGYAYRLLKTNETSKDGIFFKKINAN